MSYAECPVGHVVCPYNKAHVIRAERMQFHLTKCEPKEGDKTYAVCPYNSTHLIPSYEINNHKMNVCPDRNKLNSFLYEQSTVKPLFPVKDIEVQSQENWDDVKECTYDPEKHVENKKILLLKQVVPPSERKKFHADQRKKFQSLPDDVITKSKNKSKSRLPISKPITLGVPNTMDSHKKVEPIVDVQDENLPITENKASNEFELVVGKKRNKKTQVTTSSLQTETIKTTVDKQKKNETKVDKQKREETNAKKQTVLNDKNTKNVSEKVIINRDEPVNGAYKENVKEEDDFIVVTKKKNRARKH